jgi:hypothetical protein
MDTVNYNYAMELFYDANDKIRWRIVKEHKQTSKRDIEVSGQATFDDVDIAQKHCEFYLGDRWSVNIEKETKMTQLEIKNTSGEDVVVWITLGATSGCLQDVAKIPWITSGSGAQGSFTLKAGDTAKAWAPSNLGFNGVLSFGTVPLNCPTDEFPNGINIFEFIINNGFQTGNPKETLDISCVAGANALLSVGLSEGGAWDAGPTEPDVKSFQNDAIYKNTGNVGVFPFKCDTCTGSVNPPNCGDGKHPATPQGNAICNVQRTPGTDGLVVVSFTGNA